MVPVSGFTGPCPEMNTKSPATTAWEYGPAGAGPFSAITAFLIASPFLPDCMPPACIHVQLRRRSRGSRGTPLYNRAFSSLLQRACLYGLRPVDQDVRDPLGEVFGVFVGGRVQNGLGVEHDQVRGVSRRYEPPLAQHEPAGREGGHLPDGLLEGEQLLLPDVPGEDMREGTVEARMRLLGLVVEAVRGDKGPSPTDHLLHVGAGHVEEHDGDLPVLLEEQVHHAILGVDPSCLASFQNVLARQVRIIISAQRGDVHAIPSRGSYQVVPVILFLSQLGFDPFPGGWIS